MKSVFNYFKYFVLVKLHSRCGTSKSSEYRLTIDLSKKYHRWWCTLLVCPDWVGHSGVTNAQFSLTVSSALWLIAYFQVTYIILTAVIILDMSATNASVASVASASGIAIP